jgi:dTDP-4-amino-4,6-dideoxygalactose transaminase
MNLVSHPLALLPLVDVVAQYQSLNDELDRIVLGVLAKGRYVFGQEMEEFEEAFSQYTGARYCITSSSGTSALHLALLACGVGPGDEVIVPAMSFIASAWPITYVGATPIFAEVEWNSACIDTEKIEPLITPRTKAIVLVHLYGRVAAIDAIIDVAKKHNLLLIEDCCQAHGARFRGKHVGTFGHVGCFSFYPGKNLGTCGEGRRCYY